MIDRFKKMFLILFAIGKDILPLGSYNKNGLISLARKWMSILFSISMLTVIFNALLPFALFRTCIGIVLKILYGKLYGGLLNGLDAIFEVTPNKTVINVILIYSTKDKLATAIEKIKNCVYEIHHSSFKFGSSIKQAFGYCYYIKNQVKCEDIVNVIKYNADEYMTRNMLFDYLEKNCLTIEKNHMWRVNIFSQPILWTTHRPENKQYAIVWTLRHSLGDGPAIISLFKKYVREDDPNNKFDIQKIISKKHNINLDNICVRRNPITAGLDGLSLKIPDNSNWYISSYIETEVKYLPVIKKIKDKLNVTFTEVIGAAIATSISDYITQRKVTLDNFIMATVIRLKTEDLLKLKNGTYNFENITNNFGFVALSLPSKLEDRSLRSTILYIHKWSESLRYAVDPLVAYEFLRNICTFLPTNLIESSCKLFMDSCTVGITNLVGFQNCTWCDNTIEDAFFFSPDFLNTGFIFNVFSYDGRLQILLTSRKGFVHNREELQKILNKVFENIDKAERELLLRID